MIDRAALSVREVAQRLGIRRHSVTDLIREGELRAVDVSLVPGGRPSWRILIDDFDAFVGRRTFEKSPPRRHKRRNHRTVKRYF